MKHLLYLIQLKDYYMTMYDSVIEELPNDDSGKKIAIRSSNIEYELVAYMNMCKYL